MRVGFLILQFALLIFFRSGAQTISFSLPPNACLEQRILPTNTSTGTTAYEWDFCEGDLSLTPSAASVGSLAGNGSHAIEPVFDGFNWYAFLAIKDDDEIVRLDFGSSLDNTPTRSSLGNLGGAINDPLDIELVYANSKWYGFTYNASAAFITRIDFGASLATPPASLTTTQVVAGTGSAYCGVEVIPDGNQWYLLYTGEKTVTIARLSQIESIPQQPADFVTTGNISVFDFLGDIRALKTSGKWFAYTTSIGNSKVFRLSFGSNLFAVPSYQDITNPSWLGSEIPIGLDIGHDANKNLVFVTTNLGLIKLDVGLDPDVDLTVGTDLNNLGVLPGANKITLIKHRGQWRGFTCARFSSGVFRITFPNAVCGETPALSTLAAPTVTYTSPGTKWVTLRGFYDAVNYIEAHGSVIVSSSTSPAVDFAKSGACALHPTLFNYLGSAVTAYSWDFGDASGSADANPQHTYSSPGAYEVNLQATAANGCENVNHHTVKIYDAPVADFSLPSGLVCTGNEFTFLNTTNDAFEGNLSFVWKVENESVSTQTDLHHTFTSTGDKSIELVASIPGCSDSELKILAAVQSGPTVGFNIAGQCEGTTINFTNTSSGNIAGYSWQLNGGTPVHTQHFSFPNASTGDHAVRLEVSGANGCVSIESKGFTVYTTPVANFSLDLPPFSCAGSHSQFHDTTPSPIDSNLQSWDWTFGDGTTGSGKNPTHVYSVAGPYNVGLTITTDRGCFSTISNPVTISSSPSVSFTNDPACVTKQTQFQGSSGSTAKAWAWKIGTATYTVQNPVHVFASSAEYNVEMSATANNNCIGTISKKIVVPVAPVLDFTTTLPCAGQIMTLSATAAGTTDPVSLYQWSFSGGATQTGQSIDRTFSAAGSEQVTLKSQHQSGCSYTIAKGLTINPTPVALFSPTIKYGPAPLSVSFVNNSTGAATYKWQFDTGGVVNETSPTHVFNELGVYGVSLEATSALGCSSNGSGTVHVIIPHTDLSIDELSFSTDTQGQTRGLLTISNNSNFPISSFDLVMETGSGILITENVTETLEPFSEATVVSKNALTFQQGGAGYICVSVRVTGDEDPNNDRRCETTSDTSIPFSPYPNPAQDNIMVQYISADIDELDLRLINETGASAYSVRVAVVPGFNLLNIDVSNLGPGLYVIRVASSSSVTTERIVIK